MRYTHWGAPFRATLDASATCNIVRSYNNKEITYNQALFILQRDYKLTYIEADNLLNPPYDIQALKESENRQSVNPSSNSRYDSKFLKNIYPPPPPPPPPPLKEYRKPGLIQQFVDLIKKEKNHWQIDVFFLKRKEEVHSVKWCRLSPCLMET